MANSGAQRASAPLASAQQVRAPLMGQRVRNHYRSRSRSTSVERAFGTNVAMPEYVPDLTPLGLYMSIVRFNVGPGMLMLPFAFAQVGPLLGLTFSLPMIVLLVLSMNLIIWAKQSVIRTIEHQSSSLCLSPESGEVKRMSYTAFARIALGETGAVLVNFGVIAGQLGVCVVYHSFIATNLIVSLMPEANPRVMTIIVIPVVSLLALIRAPSNLAYLSMLGNLFMLSGILVVLIAVAPNLVTGFPEFARQPMWNWDHVPGFTSTLVYAFEGVAGIIALEVSMEEPQKFNSWMSAASATVGIIYLVFSFYCLVALGGQVHSGSISAALQGVVGDNWLFTSNIVLALAVTVTYPLQFFPGMEIIEEWLLSLRYFRRRGATRNSIGIAVFARLGVSVSCGLLAVAVPRIDLLVAVIGSLGNPVIGMILPPIIHMKMSPTRPALPLLLLEFVICGLGIYVMCFGLYQSILDIMHAT